MIDSSSINLSSSTAYNDLPKFLYISQKHVLSTDIFKQIQWHTILDNHYIDRNEVFFFYLSICYLYVYICMYRYIVISLNIYICCIFEH
jgi:hypothetical protein